MRNSSLTPSGFSVRAALLALLVGLMAMLAGCPSPVKPDPVEKPDDFDHLETSTVAWASRAAAGNQVIGERLDANDVPGAKKAQQATSALFTAPRPSDVDWFRKLALPEADLTAARAENAALLSTVLALQAEVAAGISPEEAQQLIDDERDREAARQSAKWRDRTLYGFGVALGILSLALIGLGIYLSPAGRKIALVGAAFAPCSGFILSTPSFLHSAAFHRAQSVVAYGGGAVLLALLGYAAWEVHRWIRDSKASRVAQVAGIAVESAV